MILAIFRLRYAPKPLYYNRDREREGMPRGEREGDREMEWRVPQRREKMTKREKDMGKRKR